MFSYNSVTLAEKELDEKFKYWRDKCPRMGYTKSCFVEDKSGNRYVPIKYCVEDNNLNSLVNEFIKSLPSGKFAHIERTHPYITQEGKRFTISCRIVCLNKEDVVPLFEARLPNNWSTEHG
jgi:hypothetical protein